jgi:hypothetical protein
MAVLGILLVLAAAAFLADVAVTNSLHTHLNMFGVTQNGMTNAWVFLYGAAAGFVLAIGLAMAISGMSRRARRRRAHRDALSQQRAETERLAAELERERRAREQAMATRGGTTVDDDMTYPVEAQGAHARTRRDGAVDGDGVVGRDGMTNRDGMVERDGAVGRTDGATRDGIADDTLDGRGRHASVADDRRTATRE